MWKKTKGFLSRFVPVSRRSLNLQTQRIIVELEKIQKNVSLEKINDKGINSNSNNPQLQ